MSRSNLIEDFLDEIFKHSSRYFIPGVSYYKEDRTRIFSYKHQSEFFHAMNEDSVEKMNLVLDSYYIEAARFNFGTRMFDAESEQGKQIIERYGRFEPSRDARLHGEYILSLQFDLQRIVNELDHLQMERDQIEEAIRIEEMSSK